ncbi:hypothetical protein SynBIOSU31_01517 [Synechococcus sp. BIOS-U3-1]|nr:hypothetical protein SynBIOSU31_01517 [Synechococcus sp. BIOS-U3-1]
MMVGSARTGPAVAAIKTTRLVKAELRVAMVTGMVLENSYKRLVESS